MKKYGLTPEEQNTGLWEYNHALFRNMVFPMTLIWEIDPRTGKACVMRDNLCPQMEGREQSYEEMLKVFIETEVLEEDRKAFARLTSLGMLNRMKEERIFHFRVRKDDNETRMFRFVLTPAVNEKKEPERIYFSAVDLREDFRTEEAAPGPEEAYGEEPQKRKKPYTAYLILGLLTLVLLVGVGFGIHGIKNAIFKENSGNLSRVVEKVAVNINTVMEDKWAEADYVAGQLSSGSYGNIGDFLKELKGINALKKDVGSVVVAIDRNANTYRADGEVFKWTNRGMLNGDDHEIWVTELPGLGDRESKIVYTAKLPGPVVLDDVTMTHVALVCDMKVLDEFLAMRDYGEKSVTYVIRSTGGSVYSQTHTDSELSGMFNVLSALERYAFGYDTSYEQMMEDIRDGVSGVAYATIKGVPAFVAYRKLAPEDWYAVVMVPDAEVGEDTGDFVGFLIGVMVFFAAGIIGLIVAMFVVNMKDRKQQELLSVNALRKAAATMRRAAEVEHQANEAKTRFLASMSHDIRTPMNAITGLTALASKRVNEPEYVSECLGKITKTGNHLLTLINDVLDISKVESGAMSLNVGTFSLGETVGNLVNIVRSQAAAKGQNFHVTAKGIACEKLVGDELRLSQIFLNLATNAVKYTPEGGRVDIMLTQEPAETRDVVRLTYVVRDNGIGMSEEFQKNMYTAFTRATDHRVNKVLGTGLGLAICKQMVELMKGEIICDSREGVGTTFTVILTLKKGEGEQMPPKLPPAFVWVVGGDENDLWTLKQLGLDVGMAEADRIVGKVAGHQVSGNPVRMIFIDWTDEERGEETLSAIRKGLDGDTPVLLAMAYDRALVQDRIAAGELDGFVPKPLFMTETHSALERWLCEAGEAGERAEDEPRELAGTRLLVAEDNDLNWEIVSELLADHGVTCDRAENGQVCVNMMDEAPEGKYQMILMDIQMPVMNGREASMELRGSRKTWVRDIPIVAMTADAFAEDIQACADAGMNAHISKPVNMNILLETLGRYCGASRN